MKNKRKWNVLKRGLTSGAAYDASVLDYYENLLRQYEEARRRLAEYEKRKREYEKQRKEAEERKAKAEREHREYLEKLKNETSVEEREKAAVRALEKWGNGETPDERDANLFEISDYKKLLQNGNSEQEWYEKAWRKIKDFFLSSDGITATGWKTNDIQASQFSGNLVKSREDQQLINMAEDYFKGNKTQLNIEAILELNRRKPNLLNKAAVYANKVLDWAGNNSVTGTTGAFLGTDELDKVRININFDENTTSELALLNIAALRDSYKAFDEESYTAYLENHNKAKYYENMLSNDAKRKIDIAEGRLPDENGITDGSVDFFNFSKLKYQLPGIIAGSISSPSQMVSSFATGMLTAGRILATTSAAIAATVGTGGWGAVAVPAAMSAAGAATTFGLNLASGSHENAAEVDEGYISKVKYALDLHPGVAADFYKRGRSVLGEHATEEEIITAKLANRIPSVNSAVDKAFNDAAIGSQRQFDRDMVATTLDSTIDTALEITPLKFFTTLTKSAVKANLASSRIARAANKVAEKTTKLGSKLNGGDGGVLRNAFAEYGSLVSGKAAVVGGAAGTVLDNTIGRIPGIKNAIKAAGEFDIAKIKRFGPKTSNWLSYGRDITKRGVKSAISEGVEEGKQYYNQQRAVQEFREGLMNGNLSYETQNYIGDLLDDFQAGDFAASGLVQAITGIPMLDYLHYTDTNIIEAAEAIKNIKSGMLGGHAQTTLMTATTGLKLTIGTQKAIDDFELAMVALEQNKMAAQRQFAVDQILSRSNRKYIDQAVEYLKNSNSIKLSEKELEDLQNRAVEVSGVSKSPFVKALAKEQGIAKEDYDKFVADYMYHKDNLDTERENLDNSSVQLNAKANEIRTESAKIENPSDSIFEEWLKNDTDNRKAQFESDKSAQTKRLQDHLKSLNDKLEKNPLTNSQKAEVELQIKATEESLKKVEESKFDDSEKVSYAQARFDRINTLARIVGGVNQISSLNAILSAIGEENESGKKFIQEQINAAKKLLNSWLTGNMLNGKQLTADNISDINTWVSIIKRNIERADKDNPSLVEASAELTDQINSLAQAYQEHSKAVLNYSIAANLFNDFTGYSVNENGEVVPEGTEGSKRIKGNAKLHLEGIIAAQDDDAKLEQAYKQGFADYGFAGVYKNESPLVQQEEQEEEESNPGTIDRRNRIKELGNKIGNFLSRAKEYVSGKWENFGHKKVFVPDGPANETSLDPSENQLDERDLYDRLVEDYETADDVEKWLNAPAITQLGDDSIKSNAHLLVVTFAENFLNLDNVDLACGEMDDWSVDVKYKGVVIGTITPVIRGNKAEGSPANSVICEPSGFDASRLDDIKYLESLIKPSSEPETKTVNGIIRTVQENGKIRLSLPSHTEDKPRQVVLDPQGDNKYYVHFRIWDDVDKKVPGNISDEEKKQLFDAVYDELPDGSEILLPKSGPGYYATRGTISLLQRLKKDTRFTPGTEGVVEYLDKDGKTVKKYKGTSFIKKHITQSPIETSEAQDAKIQVLNDLAKKMNNKFDVSLRTSSHYFEWIGTGENRKLKLWHRLHDEIGSHFKIGKTNRDNWSNRIKELYKVVYHAGYSEENKNGSKDIKNLLDYLQNYYKNNMSIPEERLDAIQGYILYLLLEGNDISDFDLYECIKGIAEEISSEVRSNTSNLILDRGSVIDMMCRVILGNSFKTPEDAIECCESLKITNHAGVDVLIKDYFVEGAFEKAVTHLWNTRKVYVEELGYALYTSPFTIYTEDFKNRNGRHINIAGEVDMIAIDKDGRPIIIDYKTSSFSFFDNGKLSLSFTDVKNGERSAQEQYINQQSAYIQMLNETTRKETTFTGGFECNEARLLPIHLIQSLKHGDKLDRIDVEFSKDQQLVLKTIPFTELGEKEHLIFDKEDYREKLAKLSILYAKVDYLAERLNYYYSDNKDAVGIKDIRNIIDSLDSIYLCLQEITGTDLDAYEKQLNRHILYMWGKYFANQSSIDSVCKRYKSGELELTEADKASDFNNINWKNPINDNDIDKLGGFEAMGVKDRKEYDEKVNKLAHVSCNKDFLQNSTAKLIAIPYKTRRDTDKLAVYASITYDGVTYPPIRLYLSKKNGEQFAKDVLDGNTVGANIRTTIGLLSECSDGKQHLIGESEQLIEAIGGTKENPYGDFMVDQGNNMSVAVVTFNKTTGVLSTISTNPNAETQVALPKTLGKPSANGHLVINVTPKNSLTEAPIPIICNTPHINESLGKDKANHRNQSLLEYLTEVIFPLINEVEGGDPLSARVKMEDGTEIPLTYKLLLGFFFERYDSQNGELVERPQYQIISPMLSLGETSRSIKIGNFKKGATGGAKIVRLDDTEALKDAIRPLSIWISTEMASVKWNSSKKGSKLFNEFAEFLSKLEDGEKFYLGNTNIYFDKSDADGTFLGFLAKNGLLTTPFNGFSHPLISINTCLKEEPTGPTQPPVGDGEGPAEGIKRRTTEPDIVDFDDEDNILAAYDGLSSALSEEDEDDPSVLHKIQKRHSRLDLTAARQYIERVLGKSFVDSKLQFVDEICSLTVAGLSSGAFIAGQISSNLMRLSRYAQNGTEYHEAFHWAFELIMDPKDSNKVRNIVRKKYGITGEREIAEWMADTYMYYIRRIYTPNGSLLQKAFDKINQWAITFSHIFRGDYLLYKLFNDLHKGKFINKPINNEAVLRFLQKLKYVNQVVHPKGFEKDGIEYKYQQGPIDHYTNVKQIASFALSNATYSPALNYVTNQPITINVKNILDLDDIREILMLDHNDKKGKVIPGFTKEQLVKFRQDPKKKKLHKAIDNALALRELLDDDHIEKTQEYASAYIDELIGAKGKDLSVDTKDDGSTEKTMGQEYAKVEDGDAASFAGSPKEHIIPDHQISRISKTSSRVKLFFGTIQVRSKVRKFAKNKKGESFVYYGIGVDNNGKFGYYDLKTIYQYVLNRYHYVLSPDALYNALEKDALSNPMIYSLWRQLAKIKKLASQGNNNAIGLLNEIYKNIKSTKQSHEVTKTRREPGEKWVTYRSENIMLQNNSYAISREFRDNVLGGFNRFYKPSLYKDEDKNDVLCIEVNPKIERADADGYFDSTYRDAAFQGFFGMDYTTGTVTEIIDKETGERKSVNVRKPIFSIYNIIISYGTRDAYPLYIREDDGNYKEYSIEENMPHIKFKLTEALASIGMDVTVEQIDDILETQYGGTGVLEMLRFLSETFTLPAKGNTHKAGAKVTLFKAVTDLFTAIKNEEAITGGVLRPRKEDRGSRIRLLDGRNVFSDSQAYVLMSILIAKAQYEKYEVVGRGVDGKLNYAMSDDNTVTAMCDVIFDKTGDTQCTKIRQMIMDDPFNMSDKTALFRGIPIGSFILPRINRDGVHYEIVNDAGIETGNRENSSTDSEKRGADTIMSIITKLCQNMIVLAPFADKSTALSVRLHGITLPGIDYDRVNFSFRETGKEDVLVSSFRNYIQAIVVDDTGRVIIGDKNSFNPDDGNPTIDETIALYVLAEYYQAKKAILDYKDILRNHALPGSKTEVEEGYKTALNICKKLMFMSQFSGDYIQNEESGEWTFKPFGVEKGSNKTDILAAEEMLSQFEEIVNDRNSLLLFVNRHINGMTQHELEKLLENGIIYKISIDDSGSFAYSNNLLDKNIIKCIMSAIYGRESLNSDKSPDWIAYRSLAIRIFMYDIVAKSIISKQESERLFTGQSDLYNIVRDKETRIITVPYQDQAKRIGSYASTGSVGVIEDEDYVCAEIPDDEQSIKDQVVRSIYMNEIAGYIKTGELDMKDHSDIDLRFATSDLMRELIPEGFRPLVDRKVENAMRGFVLTKKNGSENKNNVTDGASFISAEFAKKLLKSQGAWNNRIAKAFNRLNSDDKQDILQILNDWEVFNEVFTQVIGTLKYTAVGFRTEKVNGENKTVQYVNKTALFPIFACMCNDKMEAIRRQMKEQGVDMLMFESAVKVGAHGNSDFSADAHGNITGKFNTYSQKSFFLRKQLNTDPNEKEKMKIGIQTVKVALSAAINETEMEWKGELVDGNLIIDQIMNDIKALADVREKKLTDKLSTTEDVVNYVVRFLRGNNVPEATIEAFLDKIPAEALGIQKSIDTLSVKRIQEDVVRIDSPGSAFIQRSVFGVEGPNVKFGSLELNDGEELKVVNSDGSMDCVLSIDYFVEYRNGVPYFKLTPKGQKKIKLTVYDSALGKERPMSFEEIRAWLKKSNIIGKNAKASILSYRIPTQALASINALKCVDVIPVVRDTVVLPKLFTTITGSDFDIDKLFISTVWYNMEKQEDGSYSPYQIEDDETEEGLSNKVVNDYIEILCSAAKKHPEIFYRSIDLDTKLADDVIAWINSLHPITEKDKLANASGMLQAMPSSQARVHDEFQAGKLGIGPFALALVNHVLTRIYKVSFNDKGIYLKHKSLSRDTDDDGNSIMSWLSAMINKHVDVAKNPDITKLNVNNSTFSVVALLLRLGYGKRTFAFTCQDIMRDYAFAINQESAVCKYTKNDNGYNDPRQQAYNLIIKKYKLDTDKTVNKISKCNFNDILAAACREIFDRNYDGLSLCAYVLEHNGKVPSGLEIRIGKDTFELTDAVFQFMNLLLFNYLQDAMAKPLTALQLATVIDNERCITSMIQSAFYKLIVDKIKQDDTFRGIDDLFSKSYIDTKIEATLKPINTILDECTSIDPDVITAVAKAIDPNILLYGKVRMNTFLSTVRDGIVAYYGSKFFDKYCKDNNIDRRILFKAAYTDSNGEFHRGDKGIARRLAQIQKSARSNRGKYKDLRNNLLIKGLSIEGIIGELYLFNDKPFYNKHRFMNYEFLRFKYEGQSDDNILADVQLAWDQLLNHYDEDIRNFARDLIVYAFYTSGEMSGNTKLFKYVPPSWRKSSGYGDYFNNEVKLNKENQYADLEDIVDKLCRNLWYKEKFVRTIGLSTILKFQGSDVLKNNKRRSSSNSEEIGDSETIMEADPIFSPVIAGIQYFEDGSARAIFDGDKDNCPRYIKCIDDHHDALTQNDDSASAWTLYKLVGFNTYIDKNNRAHPYPIYVQTSTLGEKYYRNNIFEYNEEIEENENLDFYDTLLEFLDKLGRHSVKQNDMASAMNNILKLLRVVNIGTNLAIGEDEELVANLLMNILVDVDTEKGTTTFQPLKPADEFLENRRKRLEKQVKMTCNRP